MPRFSSPRRVAVTGVGLVSPLGIGNRENWDALIDAYQRDDPHSPIGVALLRHGTPPGVVGFPRDRGGISYKG